LPLLAELLGELSLSLLAELSWPLLRELSLLGELLLRGELSLPLLELGKLTLNLLANQSSLSLPLCPCGRLRLVEGVVDKFETGSHIVPPNSVMYAGMYSS
jgi:hypothetical protein